MILTFDYPEYRKNINDRRLWSEINTNLIFEQKEYNLQNVVVVITVFKKKNKMHNTRTLKYNLEHSIGRRYYFDTNELKKLVDIILMRSNIKFTINRCLYREKEIYGRAKIQLKFLTEGKDYASSGN